MSARTLCNQHICVTNYVDQQTLKSDDDYVLPHQRLWSFDVLVCPLSVTERFLLQPLVCGTVFHRTSLLPPSLSPSSAVVLNHISSHFLIPLSDSSLICQWLVISDTLIFITFNFLKSWQCPHLYPDLRYNIHFLLFARCTLRRLTHEHDVAYMWKTWADEADRLPDVKLGS